MRPQLSCAALALVLAHVCTSFAAPAVNPAPAGRFGHGQDDAQSDHVSSEILNHKTDIPIPQPSTNLALPTTILLPTKLLTKCQGCSRDGGDVYPSLAFHYDPNTVEDCAITFLLDGYGTRLSRLEPSSTVVTRVAADTYDTYLFQAQLSCASADEPNPVVTLLLDTLNGKRPSVFTGFKIFPSRTESSTRFLTLDAPETYYETPELSKTSIDTPFLGHEQDGHPHLISTGSGKGLSTEQRQSNATDPYHSDRCSFNSLLSALKPQVGRFKSKVQAVISNVQHKFDCHHRNSSSTSQPNFKSATTLTVHTTDPTKPETLQKFLEVQTPVVLALEAVATVLALGIVFYLFHTRFCSLRRRVERLADQEERMKAKEYRRAARREAWRRRWASFKSGFGCCFGTYELELDDEEKRALVSDGSRDDIDRGPEPLMGEAEVDGLRYSHEIVAGIIGPKRTRAAVGPRAAATSPRGHPMDVAYHTYHPRASRSRASSLPSYNSDVLPDYSSQPGSMEVARHVRIVNGLERSASPASSSGSSRYTPRSSIPCISPRPSQETLRTQSES